MTATHKIELKKLDLKLKDKEKELVHEWSMFAIKVGLVAIVGATIILYIIKSVGFI